MMSVARPNSKSISLSRVPWPSYFSPEEKRKGIRLMVSEWRRPGPDMAPTKSKAAGLYMICTLSKHMAEAQGYADALMYDYRGLVAEATGANVFFVKDGALHSQFRTVSWTALRAAPSCARPGAPDTVVERYINRKKCPDFSECFLTGTAPKLTPLSEDRSLPFCAGAPHRCDDG